MSTDEDYTGNYYQTVQKYKDSINVRVIEQGINKVVDFVRSFDSSSSLILMKVYVVLLVDSERKVYGHLHTVTCAGAAASVGRVFPASIFIDMYESTENIIII